MDYSESQIAELNKRARIVANRGQSKRHSWYETFTGTFTGFLGSFVITYYVMKYAPYSIEVRTLITTLSCTVWSIVRGYYNRRLWNWVHTK